MRSTRTACEAPWGPPLGAAGLLRAGGLSVAQHCEMIVSTLRCRGGGQRPGPSRPSPPLGTGQGSGHANYKARPAKFDPPAGRSHPGVLAGDASD